MSNIREGMPVLSRHQGEWAGSYTLVDNQGKILDQHASYLICEFVDDQPYAYSQINRYTWDNGKQEEHHFTAIYKNKKIWFDTERIDGYAWEVDAATIMLRFAYKNMPDGYLYESIFLSPCSNYRSRTWHWFKSHQVYQRTLIQEERVK